MYIYAALSPCVFQKYRLVHSLNNSASLGKVVFHVNSVYCLKYTILFIIQPLSVFLLLTLFVLKI